MDRFRCPECERPIASDRVFGIAQKLAKCDKCRRIVAVVNAVTIDLDEPALVSAPR